MKTLDAKQVEATLRELSNNGNVFGVSFIKRTTGENRDMLCRFNVKKHLKGGKPAYDRHSKNLICVFDMEKQAYRSINVDGLTRITIAGETYVIK